MIGRAIGSTIDQRMRSGPAPSTVAASISSGGMVWKYCFMMSTLKALTPLVSHSAA